MQQEGKGKEGEKIRKGKGMREKKERKGKKENEGRKEEEEKRKERRKKGKEEGNWNQHRAGAEPDEKGLGIALREVGFLLLRLFYA